MIKVYSKIELSSDIKKKILDVLTKKLGENEIEYIIDENINAGIRIEKNSEIIDLTLNSRIQEILDLLS